MNDEIQISLNLIYLFYLLISVLFYLLLYFLKVFFYPLLNDRTYHLTQLHH